MPCTPGGPPTDPAFAELGEAAAPSRPPKTPRIRAAPHPLRWFIVLAAGSGLPRFVSSLFYPTYCSLDAKVSRITGTTSRKACIWLFVLKYCCLQWKPQVCISFLPLKSVCPKKLIVMKPKHCNLILSMLFLHKFIVVQYLVDSNWLDKKILVFNLLFWDLLLWPSW